MNLAEIRAKYPQYNDLSDGQLADGLYRKFYSDMKREEFDAKIGLKPDKWSTGNILPIARNERTGETSLAMPGIMQRISDLATGKTPLQAADPITGEVRTNPEAIKGAMDTAMTVTPASVGRMSLAAKVPTTLPKLRERSPAAAAPKAVDLFDETGKLYNTLNALGPYADKASVEKVPASIRTALTEERLFPEIHGKAYQLADRMESEFKTNGATPGTIEKWRRVIKRDLLNSNESDTRESGRVAMDVLDDFINSGEGGPAAKAARSTFRKAVQADKIEFAIRQAERTAERGGKNFSHHLATQLQNLVKKDEVAAQKGRPPQFDEATRARLDKIASDRGGKLLDWLGNASPDRRLGMILQVLGFGVTGGAHVGLQAILGVGGYAAKRASERAARDAIEALQREITQ